MLDAPLLRYAPRDPRRRVRGHVKARFLRSVPRRVRSRFLVLSDTPVTDSKRDTATYVRCFARWDALRCAVSIVSRVHVSGIIRFLWLENRDFHMILTHFALVFSILSFSRGKFEMFAQRMKRFCKFCQVSLREDDSEISFLY